MILRHTGDFHLIVRQSAHARQSGVLVAALRGEFLPPPEDRAALLRAAMHHDAGWDPWDDAPRFNPDGLPVVFDDLAKGEHGAIWQRSIFGALHQWGPAAACWIARHSLALSDMNDEDRAARVELIAALALRAWPSLDEAARTHRVEQGFAALFLGDLLSLIPLANWQGPRAAELLREDGSRLTITAEARGPWAVAVSPWVFEVEALPAVAVTALAVPADQTEHAAAWLKLREGREVRLAPDYLPGGAA